MKNITMFRLFTAFIITLIAMPVLAQRANFDSERMDRDLRIMERIYTDLQRQASGANVHSNVRAVTGSYFSGYGIIFNVNETFSSSFFYGSVTPLNVARVSGQAVVTGRSGEVYNTSGRNITAELERRYADAAEAREIPVDSLSFIAYERNKDVIRDFFANYIDAIGQLDDNDRVSVVISNRGNPIVYTSFGSNSRLTSSTFNPLRAEVQIKDVVAYRTGSINESTFMDRIVFSELDAQASNHKELQVMQGIFESALKDDTKSGLRLSREVQGVLLTNFGAMFNLDVTVNITNITITGRMLQADKETGMVEVYLLDSSKVKMPMPQGYSITSPPSQSSRVKALADSSKISYVGLMNKLIDQVSDLVLDYGRTLRSLKSDELVLVSVNQLTTQADLPKRVEIQVDVQTLRDLDRGSISREQAKQKMIVRKFKS